MSGNLKPFSGHFGKVIGDQLSFYSGVTDHVPNGRMLFRASESGISREKQANGDVLVKLQVVIDDNKKASDGHLVVQDEFLLSSEGRILKSHKRAFEYNGYGNAKKWESRLGLYALGNPPTKSDAQAFASKVLVKEELLTHLKGPGKSAMNFLGETYEPIREIRKDDKLIFRFLESDTRIEVTEKSDRYDIKFSYVLDDDKDSSNGRILLEDYFKVKKKDFKLSTYVRRWALHPDSFGNTKYFQVVTQLNGKPKPSKARAQEFLTAMLPLLFSSKAPKVSPAQAQSEEKTEKPAPGKKPAPQSGPKKSAKGNGYTFSNPPAKLDATATEKNISGLLSRNLKAYMARKGSTLNVDRLKFSMKIHFHKSSGYVSKVEFGEPTATGGYLNKSALQGMFHNVAKRVHANIRATKGLRRNVINVPYTLVFQ